MPLPRPSFLVVVSTLLSRLKGLKVLRGEQVRKADGLGVVGTLGRFVCHPCQSSTPQAGCKGNFGTRTSVAPRYGSEHHTYRRADCRALPGHQRSGASALEPKGLPPRSGPLAHTLRHPRVLKVPKLVADTTRRQPPLQPREWGGGEATPTMACRLPRCPISGQASRTWALLSNYWTEMARNGARVSNNGTGVLFSPLTTLGRAPPRRAVGVLF